MMKPASEGTGIIAGGAIRKILDLAGVKNILSKRFGTTNKIANARATIMALKKLKPARGGEVKKAPETTAPREPLPQE
jgi:small subunit ribosomal protein S5